MALVGVELETLVNEQDALTTRPPLNLKYGIDVWFARWLAYF